MPQVLKDEVEARIRAAALAVFARKGFGAAGMAEIAVAAGISTGNIYRYFESKEALFAAVLPESVVRRFRSLLLARLEASRAVPDPAAPAPNAAYARVARETVEFALAHRLELVILLGRADGSHYAGVGEEVVATLVAEALRHAGEARAPTTAPLRFDLEQIYRNYVDAWVRILERFEDPAEITAALRAYERYHLTGLRAFFA